MGVAMERTHKTSMVHLPGLLSKWTVLDGGLETTSDVITCSQVFTKHIQHLCNDDQRIF